MADLDSKLSQRVREVREELGLSQADLANRMRERGHSGFQQQTVARIETGNRKVTYGEAVDLAVAMNHTPEGLVGTPGEDALVARGTRVGEASGKLHDAALEYTNALFAFMVTADAIDSPIRENQQRFMEAIFQRQTPAMMTLDASAALRSAISRAKIESPGHHLRRLLEAIERDDSALRQIRPGLEEL